MEVGKLLRTLAKMQNCQISKLTPRQINYLSIGELNFFSGLFILGTEMDKSGHKSIEKSGFSGALSQVTLWERVLDSQELNNVFSDSLSAQQIPSGFVSLWDNYISSEAVDIRKPSTVCVNKPNCQSNDEGNTVYQKSNMKYFIFVKKKY